MLDPRPRKCCPTPRGPGPHAAGCPNNPANQGARTAATLPDGTIRWASADVGPDFPAAAFAEWIDIGGEGGDGS